MLLLWINDIRLESCYFLHNNSAQENRPYNFKKLGSSVHADNKKKVQKEHFTVLAWAV